MDEFAAKDLFIVFDMALPFWIDEFSRSVEFTVELIIELLVTVELSIVLERIRDDVTFALIVVEFPIKVKLVSPMYWEESRTVEFSASEWLRFEPRIDALESVLFWMMDEFIGADRSVEFRIVELSVMDWLRSDLMAELLMMSDPSAMVE